MPVDKKSTKLHKMEKLKQSTRASKLYLGYIWYFSLIMQCINNFLKSVPFERLHQVVGVLFNHKQLFQQVGFDVIGLLMSSH